MTEQREKAQGIQNASLSRLPPWHLTFSSSLSLILHSNPLLHQHISPPISPRSLYPRFFISSPLTVPWHSKALLPSLTFFHGAADDNNWFENRRQWDTRIIPGSHPPPPLPHTHTARTLLLCILPSTSCPRLSCRWQISLSLVFLVLCFIIVRWPPSLSNFPNPPQTFFFLLSWILQHTHTFFLSLFLVFLEPLLPFIHIFSESCEISPHRDKSSLPAKSGSDITEFCEMIMTFD